MSKIGPKPNDPQDPLEALRADEAELEKLGPLPSLGLAYPVRALLSAAESLDRRRRLLPVHVGEVQSAIRALVATDDDESQRVLAIAFARLLWGSGQLVDQSRERAVEAAIGADYLAAARAVVQPDDRLRPLPAHVLPLPSDIVELGRIERGLSESARARQAGDPLPAELEHWFGAQGVRILSAWRRWRPLVRGILWQIAGALQHLVRRRRPQRKADLSPVYAAAARAVEDDGDSIVLASFEERLSAGRAVRRLRQAPTPEDSPTTRPDWRRYRRALEKAQSADRCYYVATRQYLRDHPGATRTEAYQAVADRFDVNWKTVQSARSEIAALVAASE